MRTMASRPSLRARAASASRQRVRYCRHWRGEQVALAALGRFTDEEIKHQQLFRRLERMMADEMPAGYEFRAQPHDVANAVPGKSTWAVLALTCSIELCTQAHYRQSVAADPDLSALWKDVLRFHWREECQHALLDELEWVREDAKLSAAQRDRDVTDLIELVAGLDAILQSQAAADASYFLDLCARPFTRADRAAVRAAVLGAYRRQYIAAGLQDERFAKVLGGMIDGEQARRIGAALAPILE